LISDYINDSSATKRHFRESLEGFYKMWSANFERMCKSDLCWLVLCI